MKKKSHYLVTKHLLGNLNRVKKRYILIGSVMPDFLLYTFKKGHYYHSTKDQILSSLERLEAKEKWSKKDFYLFGYALHFIEDYFTFPHNFPFLKNAKSHYSYEKKLQNQIPNYTKKRVYFNPSPLPYSAFLEELHAEYLTHPQSIEIDFFYMFRAVKELLYRFRHQIYDENIN